MSFILRFFLFVLLLSYCELYLLILVADKISLLLTLALCVLTGVLGGALVRAQGLTTFRVIRDALARGQVPAAEIVAGLILVIIGTLLLTPGFITDSVAFLLLIPPLRALAAQALLRTFKRRINLRAMSFNSGEPRSRPGEVIIEVDAEVVEEKPGKHSPLP